MAPQDWVLYAVPIWAPLADKFDARKLPMVTNQPPQMKNWRNIMTQSRA
jgi:hypothetical protein